MGNRAKWTVAALLAGAVLLPGSGRGQSNDNFSLLPTIAFAGVDNLPCLAERNIRPMNQPSVAEIFLMSPDYTNVRRLTDNANCTHADSFPSLSGDGKRILFESNRLRSPDDPPNT